MKRKKRVGKILKEGNFFGEHYFSTYRFIGTAAIDQRQRAVDSSGPFQSARNRVIHV